MIFATRNDINQINDLMILIKQTTPDLLFISDDKEFISRHIDSEGKTIIIKEDNMVVAFLMLRFPAASKDNLGLYIDKVNDLNKVIHIESVGVNPRYRGKGYMSKMLEYVLEYYSKDYYFCTNTHPENTYSKDIFINHGFTIEKEFTKYDKYPRILLYKH